MITAGQTWRDWEAWAAFVDLPAAPAGAVSGEANGDRRDVTRPTLSPGDRAAVRAVTGVGFEVGFVAVEFDAGGHLMGDGRLYADRGIAQGTVDRRNAAEGWPELLDRWFVLPVVVDTAEASAAHLQALALRPGQRATHTPPTEAGLELDAAQVRDGMRRAATQAPTRPTT